MFFLMSTPVFSCQSFIPVDYHSATGRRAFSLQISSNFLLRLGRSWGCYSGTAVRARNDRNKKILKKKRKWWQWIFSDDESGWPGLTRDEWLDESLVEDPTGEESSEREKFEAWKTRAEAIVELREAQQDMLNEESRRWEDWVVDTDLDNREQGSGSWWNSNDGGDIGNNGGSSEFKRSEPVDLLPKKEFFESVRKYIYGNEDEDALYEDRIFRFASLNSAKFLALIVLVPWGIDFVVHDYVLVPFLDRYVKTVPLAAQMLDVRRSQKLEMVKEIKFEKERIRFEVEIGKSPPLTDEELWKELRSKALELREEKRSENRKSFANIWSDMVFGVTLFLLLYLNPSKVALLQFTGYKIINNISDAGKAFFIILISDIFLGYHSESGWETLLEVVIDHYGVQVDAAAVTIFISVIPVAIDTCVKLWLFKFLPRISPRVANILREMRRH